MKVKVKSLSRVRLFATPRTAACQALPFSRGPSRPRNRTRVSLIAGRRFTAGAIREALCLHAQAENTGSALFGWEHKPPGLEMPNRNLKKCVFAGLGRLGYERQKTGNLFFSLHSAILCYIQSICDDVAFPTVVYSLRCFQLFLTRWTVACQVPLCMGFEARILEGFPFPSPANIPYLGI